MKNCAGKNVQSLEIVGVDIKADGEVCKFPSHFSSDEITGILTKYGILDDQAGAGASPPKCSDPGTDNTCGEQECFIKQIQPYYPTWNGTCVPVSCNLSDDIKNIYNINKDTFSNKRVFFSHRRESQKFRDTGRMLNIIAFDD